MFLKTTPERLNRWGNRLPLRSSRGFTPYQFKCTYTNAGTKALARPFFLLIEARYWLAFRKCGFLYLGRINEGLLPFLQSHDLTFLIVA